jgi:hypothetical protein
MTELSKRFNDYDNWFIDGMTNQFLGHISFEEWDAELSDISTENLFKIISLYSELRGRYITEISQRWLEDPKGDGIYQDFYDEIFDEYQEFFEQLAENNFAVK